MAAGLGVAATDAGGIGELVRPGETGALSAKGDPEGLAEALELVLSQSGEMGAAGRRIAEAELSLDTMLGRLVGLYDQLMARMRE